MIVPRPASGQRSGSAIVRPATFPIAGVPSSRRYPEPMADALLAGRKAVVTGASAGIGLAIAEALAGHGAGVVINGRRPEPLAAARERLARAGGVATAVVGDCADEGVIARLFDAARALSPSGRGADVVVVNAGRGLRGSVMDSDPAQWEEMVRTNIIAAARLMRAAGRAMLEEIEHETGLPVTNPPATGLGAGSERVLSRPRDLVVIGSNVGRHISPFSSMYGSTKFAANSLAEALRRELGPRGVRVSLIEPGFVESEFQGVAGYDPAWFAQVKGRIGPVLAPADVARLVAFVVSQPPWVHVCDALIRPTRQDYP